jgi:dihydrofolate reductase (trimethoprim resistance protein)
MIIRGNKFQRGDYVHKIKGSEWVGKVVGFYSTSLTEYGYCIESETHKGSVQNYPEAALDFVEDEGE